MTNSLRAWLALALMACVVGPVSPAFAQTKPQQPASAPVSVPVNPQQASQEEMEREKLNQSQAEYANRQLEDNAASRREVQEYDQARRDHEATVARLRAEDAAAQAAFEAERLRREQDHEAAMARWRADVAACNAGDVSRCTVRQ